jgi:hypothetical protein
MADRIEIGEATDHDQLVAILRARKAALELSDTLVDEIAGLTTGHCQKILGAKPTKTLGRISLSALLGALGVKLVVVVDPDSKIARRWQRRAAGMVHPTLHTIGQARPIILSRAGRKAALARWGRSTPELRAVTVAALNRARAAKRSRRAGTKKAA